MNTLLGLLAHEIRVVCARSTVGPRGRAGVPAAVGILVPRVGLLADPVRGVRADVVGADLRRVAAEEGVVNLHE